MKTNQNLTKADFDKVVQNEIEFRKAQIMKRYNTKEAELISCVIDYCEINDFDGNPINLLFSPNCRFIVKSENYIVVEEFYMMLGDTEVYSKFMYLSNDEINFMYNELNK